MENADSSKNKMETSDRPSGAEREKPLGVQTVAYILARSFVFGIH